MTLMSTGAETSGVLTAVTSAFYRSVVQELQRAGIPFLVGGAYALARYTGVERHTKDFDIFVRESDLGRTMETVAKIGCDTDIPFPHWLAKAYCGDDFVDIIFSSGNGIAIVDDEWFIYAPDEKVLDLHVKLIPPEEMLWSKAFVMERERYDGADICHLLRSVGKDLDWHRVLRRFGDNWRILFNHLIVYGFVYPAESGNVPRWVMEQLSQRLHAELTAPLDAEKLCRGTLISREQYLIDVEQWGYRDARLPDHGGHMSRREINRWTEAIDEPH